MGGPGISTVLRLSYGVSTENQHKALHENVSCSQQFNFSFAQLINRWAHLTFLVDEAPAEDAAAPPPPPAVLGAVEAVA